MVSSSISKAFNLIGLGHFAFALYYHFTVISPIDVKFRGFEFGGPFIYITILASVRKQNNFELWKFFSVKKILSVNFSRSFEWFIMLWRWLTTSRHQIPFGSSETFFSPLWHFHLHLKQVWCFGLWSTLTENWCSRRLLTNFFHGGLTWCCTPMYRFLSSWTFSCVVINIQEENLQSEVWFFSCLATWSWSTQEN